MRHHHRLSAGRLILWFTFVSGRASGLDPCRWRFCFCLLPVFVSAAGDIRDNY